MYSTLQHRGLAIGARSYVGRNRTQIAPQFTEDKETTSSFRLDDLVLEHRCFNEDWYYNSSL